MPNGLIDPARLEGEELRRWYSRTPEEIERERQAKYARDHDEFFYRASPRQSVRAGTAATRTQPSTTPASPPNAGTRYGSLYAPPPDDLAELRRQQAEFERTRRAISKENSWMAVPALAPAAAVIGLEAGAAIAARLAPQAVSRAPLVLTERMPYLRVGHNWATKAGQRAHRFYKEMAQGKPGWEYEPKVLGPNGKTLKPDLGAPPRTPDPAVRRYVEVKPNTPSGRAAADKAIKKYGEATGQNVGRLLYDPKRFMR
jgi:hypothetical protein